MSSKPLATRHCDHVRVTGETGSFCWPVRLDVAGRLVGSAGHAGHR